MIKFIFSLASALIILVRRAALFWLALSAGFSSRSEGCCKNMTYPVHDRFGESGFIVIIIFFDCFDLGL